MTSLNQDTRDHLLYSLARSSSSTQRYGQNNAARAVNTWRADKMAQVRERISRRTRLIWRRSRLSKSVTCAVTRRRFSKILLADCERWFRAVVPSDIRFKRLPGLTRNRTWDSSLRPPVVVSAAYDSTRVLCKRVAYPRHYEEFPRKTK